jgi:centromeric protein E
MLSGSSNGDGNGSSADSSIKVAVRVRPLNEKEINSGQSLGWKVTDNCVSLLESRGYSASKFNYGVNCICSNSHPKLICTVDYVMDANFPTNSIYQHIAQDLILSVMKGYHGTVFAYGQTSSGKTFTMSGNDEHPGIIPLAMRDVFQFIQEVHCYLDYVLAFHDSNEDTIEP